MYKLVWKSSPKLTFTQIAADTLTGLIPLINVWALKALVDSVPKLTHTSPAELLALHGNASTAMFAVGLLALSWFGFESLQPISLYCREQLNDLLTRDINLMIVDKINASIDITILENPKFYDTLQKLQGDMAYKPIQMLIVTSQLARALVTMVSLFLVLATLSPWLILLLAVFCMPKSLYQLKKSYEVWKIFEGDAPELRRMKYYTDVMSNNLDGKEVRVFGLGPFFRELYTNTFLGFQKRRVTIRKSHLMWSVVLSLVSAIGTVWAYLFTILSAINGITSVGSMAMYIGCIAQMEQYLGEVSWLVAELHRHVVFIRLLNDFVAIPPAIPLQNLGIKPIPDPIREGIEFRNVSFSYPDSDKMVLENLSFKLNAGSTIAIVAENGAGKTTIVKLLSRLYDPTAGEILLDGVDLRELDPIAWRARMAVVFQDYCRFQMTLRENIGVGDTNQIEKLDRIEAAAERSGASQVAAKLSGKYETMLGKMFEEDTVGTELSGGEWQKIALARAFMRSSDNNNNNNNNGASSASSNGKNAAAQLLILDEPTAALDVQSEADVYQHFHELTRGNMAVLISHRFSTVKIADQILVLEGGKVAEHGSHKELMAAGGMYSRLYNLQAERYL